MGCHRLTYHQKTSSKTENTPIFVMGKKQGSDYQVFGMVQPGRSFNLSESRYGFNGMESDNEVSGNGNSYTTEFRQYDPRLGRWKSLDPLMSMFPDMSPYAAFANNPIFFTDPYGLAPANGPDDPKEVIKEMVTSIAEAVHNLYRRAEYAHNQIPFSDFLVNRILDGPRLQAWMVTDMDEETMNWIDLLYIWAFEFGDFKDDIMYFKDGDKTTEDLKNQEGVNQAREKALEKIESGDISKPVSKGWTYDEDKFYDGVKELNVVTSFLGSYNTEVDIEENTDGSFTLNFTVTNTTSWESGTRLRKDNDKDGSHDGIIPNKVRGEGINMGGNLIQNWSWSETIPAPKSNNKQKSGNGGAQSGGKSGSKSGGGKKEHKFKF